MLGRVRSCAWMCGCTVAQLVTQFDAPKSVALTDGTGGIAVNGSAPRGSATGADARVIFVVVAGSRGR
jgi:hypothetical protein